ncbi:hypothetical protein [Pedobacter steynii]|uniref:hypothetical protein n=1 Tax=Pedobacter steynii TaxID=430522 RepID=UPI0012F7C473|nr:hypothetical protein [Pedobacter steynii]
MKKLILGLTGLMLVSNLGQAQSVKTEIKHSSSVSVGSLVKQNLSVNSNTALANLSVGNSVPISALSPLAPITNVTAEAPLSVSVMQGVQDEKQGADDPMRSKTFSRSFTLDGSDKINLSNKYGTILIKTWDKKEIKVDVDIKAYSKDAGDAQKLLDETTIEAGKSADLVSFRTIIGTRDGRYGSSTRNGKLIWRREVRVNYVVYMPASNDLSVSNTYGGLTMGNLSGALYAKVQYGGFVAGTLNNSNNYISVQYGSAEIEELNKAVIKQQYGSGLTVGTIGTLDLDAQYTTVNIKTIKGNATVKQQYGKGLNIGAVNNLELDAQYVNVNLGTIHGNATVKQQYNSISIGSVNKLNIRAQYANVKLNNLKGDGNFDLDYNKLSIENIGAGCKNLTVNADYASVSLGFDTGYHADFDVQTRYGGFSPGSASSKQIGDGDTSKHYAGKIGNGGGGTINIKADYGSVSFR